MKSNTNPYIVWALFDDDNRSYYKALNDLPDVRVISIGIKNNDGPDYFKCDLSITNPELKQMLDKLPKPDIIYASPPCESWSIADNQQKCFTSVFNDGETSTLRVTRNHKWYDNHNDKCPKTMRRNFFKQDRSRLIGESTISGTLWIINEYRPKHWVIENPATSMIWDYIDCYFEPDGVIMGYKNKARYNNYDKTFTQKPTIFLSNIKLELLNDIIPQEKRWEQVRGYTQRSSIPKSLIMNIQRQLEESICINQHL